MAAKHNKSIQIPKRYK